ncbi:hypothetical protein C5167_024880 [Papaver somniferum]|uniref:TF-B3 domain-containing protein n=1 Tax=Papaver somniferum TaxID=3469 RepID=A0A4Y7JTW5_PAPSO|nr:B3 domain-containing transcription factor VRN1-like isoform X2 [Papaver somniferum]RZC63135.1 hypothetical protein C5167_024880 [Papaver somniferum]
MGDIKIKYQMAHLTYKIHLSYMNDINKNMGSLQSYSSPSFFKVMAGDFAKKLKIPVNFIEKFNGVIPYDSMLRSPLGCWNVKVREEEDGSLSFRKGWSDFVESHYLRHEDFVTVKYIGNSQFSVKLYGKNGCEKVLPSSIGSNGAKSIPSRKRKEFGETCKGTFSNYGSEFDHYQYHAGDIGRDSSLCSDKRDCGLFRCEALKKKAIFSKRRTGVDQAECSGRRKKPYFLAIWTENKRYQLEIPQKVVRKIGRTLSDIIALKRADGILWNVELKRSEGKVWFDKGWKEFAEHNSLRDGHVLGISYNGNSRFSVCITNVMDHLDDSRNQGESNPKKRCPLSKRVADDEDVLLLDSPAPSRTHVESKTNEERRQSPAPSRTHVESKTNEERRQLSCPPGIDIPMHLNKNEGTKYLVSDETKSAYLEGERTPSGERLPVVKGEESEDTSDSADASKLFLISSRRDKGIERVAEVTRLFERQTQFPFFAVCMRDTYLTYGYLHVPNYFAKKYLPKNIKNIIVRSSDNKVWTIGYIASGKATKLSTGWTSLRRHLGLTEDDVCVFELLKEKDPEMRVFVFREIDNVLTRI